MRHSPKMTAKYKAALETARALNIDGYASWGGNYLYEALAKMNFTWDAETGVWWILAADTPSDLIRLRIWAKTEDVTDAARQIADAMEVMGYKLVEQSQPYICRPPKQLESRVYYTFQKPEA